MILKATRRVAVTTSNYTESLISVSVLPWDFATPFSSHPWFDAEIPHPLNLPEPPSTCTSISVMTWISCFASSLGTCETLAICMTSPPWDRGPLRPCVLPMVAYCRGPVELLRVRDEKVPGRKRVKSGRRSGRHEQMMPTLVSTELHVAAGGLS